MSRFTVTAERSGDVWVLQAVEAPAAISQVSDLDEAEVIVEAIAFVTGESEASIEIRVRRVFAATAIREGEWWMITIPELDGVTQARESADVPAMAREYIAAALDIPHVDVEVRVTGV